MFYFKKCSKRCSPGRAAKERDLSVNSQNEKFCVEDFVDFLRTRGDAQQLTRAAARAAEPAFKKVWDNPDDAAYDRL